MKQFFSTSNVPQVISRKLAIGISALIIVVGTLGCSDTNASATLDTPLVIEGELQSCTADSMRLYEVVGAMPRRIAAGKVEVNGATGKFSIKTKLPRKGVYMLGDDPRRAASFLLDKGGTYALSGNSQNPIGTYKLANSSSNDGYQVLIQRVNTHNQKVQQLVQNMRIFQMSDPAQLGRLQADMDKENKAHHSYLDSLVKGGGILGKVATIYNFRPFGMDPADRTNYTSELQHFEKNFFTGIDFKDEELAALPQLYEKAQVYANTLPQAGYQTPMVKTALDALLAKATVPSLGHENLLRGFLGAFEQSKNELFVDYGKIYLANYTKDQAYAANIQAMVSQLEAFRPGALAPEITQPQPDGKMLSLSSLRGQVVLIDFWASWCGPCRRENPNVVAAYNKYHKAGFEILGVSLDKDKTKWEEAIKQDGLIWKHVSDLGFWNSIPARTYGVNSIPATVLVDKEGKIIARNLRGPALEAKLAEIFGF